MKSIILTVIALLFAGVIALFAFSEAEKAIRIQAIGDCLQTGRITMQKDGQTYTIPENYWYDFCMKEKGLKK